MWDAEGALEEWNTSDTGAMLRREWVRGRWVAKASSDSGDGEYPGEPTVGAGCCEGEKSCEAHIGGLIDDASELVNDTAGVRCARSVPMASPSSPGEKDRGSGCKAAYEVVGEKGVTSGKIDEFSL